MPDTHRLSQADIILRLLESPLRGEKVYFNGPHWEDGWITLPAIMKLGIASYTRRISDLRKRGFNIECQRETINGQVRTKYRLVKS